jgi:hypothetical protein
VGLAVLAVGCVAAFLISRSEIGSPQAGPEPPPRSWQSGGTLHNADVRRWRAATHENRLATSVDLITTAMLHRGTDPRDIRLDEVKTWATELEACISGGAGESVAEDAAIAEIAATCMAGIDF